MDPADFNPKKDLKGKAKETEAFESWVDSMVDEGGIKPYVSMSRGEDNGKMMYNVLDRNEKTIYVSKDEKEATEFLRKNYDRLKSGEMEVAEYAKEPKNPEDRDAKLKALQDIQMDPNTAKDPEMVKTIVQRKKELMKEPVAAEGNQFAQAVQKAKAAGMKSGDKFKVGDDEYTLKDAIEMAGLQLEEFFSEEELMYDNQIDRIKNLAFYQ